MKILVNDGKVYEAQNTFHNEGEIKKNLQNFYNGFVNKRPYYNSDRGTWERQAQECDILVIQKGTEECNEKSLIEQGWIFESFEENLTRRGGFKKVAWEYFIKHVCVVTENIPVIDFADEVMVKTVLSDFFWDFSNVFPNFFFASYKDKIENGILSMNPVASTSAYYFGTLEEFMSKHKQAPRQCVFIANNCTPVQQCMLSSLLSKARTHDDRQGCAITIHSCYWEVIYC